LDWNADDSRLLLREYVSINESHLYALDIAGQKLSRLTPATGKELVAYRDAVFSKDGRSVYLTTDRDAEFLYLAALDPASGKLTPLAKAEGDVEAFDL